jgi:hypothetical protein
MAEAALRPGVVEETTIYVDAGGNVTDDPAKAVRGEILERYADGHTESTLFTVEADAH